MRAKRWWPLLVCVCGLPSFKGLKRAAAGPTTKPSRRPFQGNSLQTSAGLSKATLAATGHLFLSAFKTAICPPSNRYRPQPSVFEGVQNCRLPALKPLKPSRKPFQGNSCSFPQAFAATCPRQCFKPFRKPFHSNSRSYRPQPSVFRAFKTGVCPSNPPASLSKATLAASRRHFQGNSCSYMPQTMLQTSASLSNATLAATGPSHLFLSTFKTAVCPPSNRYRPQPSVFKGVQNCRLPGLNPLKPSRKPFQGNSCSFPQAFPRQLLQLHAPDNASNLPQAFPQQLSQLQAPTICF